MTSVHRRERRVLNERHVRIGWRHFARFRKYLNDRGMNDEISHAYLIHGNAYKLTDETVEIMGWKLRLSWVETKLESIQSHEMQRGLHKYLLPMRRYA